MNETQRFEKQLIETTEVRRHNGQCAYGPWIALKDAPEPVQATVSEEVAERMFADTRHEPATENTDEAGSVLVGGMKWLYRR